jgi:hypothetical protein
MASGVAIRMPVASPSHQIGQVVRNGLLPTIASIALPSVALITGAPSTPMARKARTCLRSDSRRTGVRMKGARSKAAAVTAVALVIT